MLLVGSAVADGVAMPDTDEQAQWANETYGEGNWSFEFVEPDCSWYDIGCGGLQIQEPVPVNESVPNASERYIGDEW